MPRLIPGPPYPFRLRNSRIHGRGAFATQFIPEGTRIIEYKGERISNEEADRRYPDDPAHRHHTFLFSIDDEVVVDAAFRGNAARWINHSCDPNCDAVIEDGRIFIEAVRDIAPGEELVYDYNFVLEERHTPAMKRRYPCHCGAPNCRGTILAKKR
jgi:SET domain-containing protein